MGKAVRHVGGQKALLWVGLSAHRSKAMRALAAPPAVLAGVERLPGYAPELNPAEALWANLKEVELANLAADTLAEELRYLILAIQRATGCWPRSCGCWA